MWFRRAVVHIIFLTIAGLSSALGDPHTTPVHRSDLLLLNTITSGKPWRCFKVSGIPNVGRLIRYSGNYARVAYRSVKAIRAEKTKRLSRLSTTLSEYSKIRNSFKKLEHDFPIAKLECEALFQAPFAPNSSSQSTSTNNIVVESSTSSSSSQNDSNGIMAENSSSSNSSASSTINRKIFPPSVVMKIKDTQTLRAATNVPQEIMIQHNFSWAELNPSRGVYDWAPIEDLLNAAGTRKVMIRIIAVASDFSSDDLASNSFIIPPNTSTPAWVLNDPLVSKMGGTPISTGSGTQTLPLMPVYWDSEYLAYANEFMAALATEIDSNQQVQLVFASFYSNATNEPNFYGEMGKLPEMISQIQANGIPDYVGQKKLPANTPYTDAVLTVLDGLHQFFLQTEIGVIIHFPNGVGDSFEQRMNDRVLLYGFDPMSTGLNEKPQENTRTTFAQWKATFNVRPGWGGITQLGETDPNAVLLDAYRQGIGDVDLQPYSLVGYVTFQLNGSSISQTQLEAYEWAKDRLVP